MKQQPIDILLIEDNEYDAELTMLALRDNRVTNNIKWLKDGQEAVDFILGQGEYASREINNQPRVVLLDIQLPKLNGLEVLKIIRNNPKTHKLPVVMLTSSKEDSDVLCSYETGANSYLVKPVDFEEFIKVVRDMGFYWMLLNEPPV